MHQLVLGCSFSSGKNILFLQFCSHVPNLNCYEGSLALVMRKVESFCNFSLSDYLKFKIEEIKSCNEILVVGKLNS